MVAAQGCFLLEQAAELGERRPLFREPAGCARLCSARREHRGAAAALAGRASTAGAVDGGDAGVPGQPSLCALSAPRWAAAAAEPEGPAARREQAARSSEQAAPAARNKQRPTLPYPTLTWRPLRQSLKEQLRAANKQRDEVRTLLTRLAERMDADATALREAVALAEQARPRRAAACLPVSCAAGTERRSSMGAGGAEHKLRGGWRGAAAAGRAHIPGRRVCQGGASRPAAPKQPSPDCQAPGRQLIG